MKIDRRKFIAGSALTLSAGPALGHRWHRQRRDGRSHRYLSDDVFTHGVASGDPLQRSVLLWTAVRPSRYGRAVPVIWKVYSDPSCRRAIRVGVAWTSVRRDFTVKVVVRGLKPGTTYYYRFFAQGESSPIGRTRTLGGRTTERLRFAVASCSNHPYGYFSAYRRIAERNDLDLVMHLGDYIYEYAEGTYGDGEPLDRLPIPNAEIVSLEDYRARHAQYKRDPDLQECHRQHPWICAWDDHESTNNAWVDGAENHQPETEGDWEVRKQAAIQAYFEWMPIRESRNPNRGKRFYRGFRAGRLAQLDFLETRLTARSEQIDLANDADGPIAALAKLADPNRTLLGDEQEDWLLDRWEAAESDGVRWKFLCQQVMFNQLLLPGPTGELGPFNTDQWDGYTADRDTLFKYLTENSIDNTVVLTGDIHSSWGNDLSVNPLDPSAATVAVEFVTPGITSPAFDDPVEAARTGVFVQEVLPRVRYVELNQRGYCLVDVDDYRCQAEWYHVGGVDEIRNPDNEKHEFAMALQTIDGTNQLIEAAASAPVADAPALAPERRWNRRRHFLYR